MNEADAQVVVQAAGVNWVLGKELWYEWQALKKSQGEKALSSAEFSRFVYDAMNDEADDSSIFDEEAYETEAGDFAGSGLSLEEEIEQAKNRERDVDEGSDDSLLHVVDKLSSSKSYSTTSKRSGVKERTDLTKIIDKADSKKNRSTKNTVVHTGETTEEESDFDEEECADSMMFSHLSSSSKKSSSTISGIPENSVRMHTDPTDSITTDAIAVISSSANNPARQFHALMTVKGQSKSFKTMDDCCVKMAMKCINEANSAKGLPASKRSPKCASFSCQHFGNIISVDEANTAKDIQQNVKKAKQVTHMHNLLRMAQTDDTISSRIADHAEKELEKMVSISDNLYAQSEAASNEDDSSFASVIYSEYSGMDLRKLKNTELDDINKNAGVVRESTFSYMVARSLGRSGFDLGQGVHRLAKRFISYALKNYNKNRTGIFLDYQSVTAYVLGVIGQMHYVYMGKKKAAYRRQIANTEVDTLSIVYNAMISDEEYYLTNLQNQHKTLDDIHATSSSDISAHSLGIIGDNVSMDAEGECSFDSPNVGIHLRKGLRKAAQMAGSIFGDNQFQHLRRHANYIQKILDKRYKKYRYEKGRQDNEFLNNLARVIILENSFKAAKSTATRIGMALKVMVGSQKEDYMHAIKAAIRIFAMLAINLLTYYNWDDAILKQYPAITKDSVFTNMEAYMYQARVFAAHGANPDQPKLPPKPGSTTVDDRTDGIPGEHDYTPPEFPPVPTLPPRLGKRIQRNPVVTYLNDPDSETVEKMTSAERSFVKATVKNMLKEDMMTSKSKNITVLIPERRKLNNDAQSKYIYGSLHSFVLDQKPVMNKNRPNEEHWSGCPTKSGKRGLEYLFDAEESILYPLDTERARLMKSQVGGTLEHPSGQSYATVKRFRTEIPVSPAFSVVAAGLSEDYFLDQGITLSLRRIERD